MTSQVSYRYAEQNRMTVSLYVMFGFGVPLGLTYPIQHTAEDRLIWGLFLILGLAMFARASAIQFVINDDHVVVRNVFTTRRIPFDDIEVVKWAPAIIWRFTIRYGGGRCARPTAVMCGNWLFFSDAGSDAAYDLRCHMADHRGLPKPMSPQEELRLSKLPPPPPPLETNG